MTAVSRLGARALLAAFRGGELSPTEAVEALIAAADEPAPRLNALAADCPERALAEAEAATERFARARRAGAPPGSADLRPLEGVPFLAKDLFDTAGLETAYGSPTFAGHVPDRDAETVRRAREAGAILLAKTSTDEFAYGITSHNPHFGAVRNPWDPERISGGSSGGSAAALAAGLAPLALGSDTGGSIRVPASFCGTVGFKPTWDSVSTAGLFPMARTLDHAGPMAREVGDARLLFEVIRRRSEAGASPEPTPPPRFVLSPDLQIAPPDRAIAAAIAGAVERAREAGAEVDERRFAEADRLFPTFLPIQQVETSFTHRSRGLYPDRRDGYGADVQARLDAAAVVDLDAYLAANAERDRLRLSYEAMLDGDALLLKGIHSRPAAPIGTPEVEELTRRNAMDQTVPENLLGLPACALRAGFDASGMPVGIQVIGRRGADDAVLAAAAWLEDLDPDLRDRRPALLERVSG